MKKMTDVELQIMDCIWSIGTDVSPSQVLTLLNERFSTRMDASKRYLPTCFAWLGKGYLTYQRKRSGICLSSTNHKGCLF